MDNYVLVNNDEDCVGVTFFIEQEKILKIGNKMNEICEDAYMNGDNWEAFFNYYLDKNAPELLEGLESDPEAGMYAANYDEPDALQKAEKFVEIIKGLVENEERLYQIVREEADNIEWN